MADDGFLRFLARWDRGPEPLRRAMESLAGHPVRFSGRPPPLEASSLFGAFARDPLGAVSQLDDGSWCLPYDPFAAWRAIVEERWLGEPRRPLHAAVPLPYHAVPGWLRMALYPLVAGRPAIEPEACPPDPAWPIEGRVDAFRRTLYEGIAGPASVEPWPAGKRFPLLVTLDVDTRHGLELAGPILDELVALGVKPCFFLVGKGYRWDLGFCDAVRQAGGEIGLHGDLHDNRIAFLDQRAIARRLDTCKDLVTEHRILGFRSPSLLVSDALYEAVSTRFAWDSSVPDTDTHTLLGPRRGCGTAFPFRRANTLVLPTTMPADDRLLLLGYRGMKMLEPLRRKWRHLRDVGGLVHFLLHPEPHLFGKRVVRDLVKAAIGEILDSGEAWVTTPSAVADHWRGLEAD